MRYKCDFEKKNFECWKFINTTQLNVFFSRFGALWWSCINGNWLPWNIWFNPIKWLWLLRTCTNKVVISYCECNTDWRDNIIVVTWITNCILMKLTCSELPRDNYCITYPRRNWCSWIFNTTTRNSCEGRHIIFWLS